jgi:hypothetical protein
MVVRREQEGTSLVPTVVGARRAIVFLSVSWSTPERLARIVFEAAARELASSHGGIGAKAFLLQEDADESIEWLQSLGLAGLGEAPRGAGTILWLEHGRPVDFEFNGSNLTMAEVVERSIGLWTDS